VEVGKRREDEDTNRLALGSLTIFAGESELWLHFVWYTVS
jgi:hypothetical protein